RWKSFRAAREPAGFLPTRPNSYPSSSGERRQQRDLIAVFNSGIGMGNLLVDRYEHFSCLNQLADPGIGVVQRREQILDLAAVCQGNIEFTPVVGQCLELPEQSDLHH